MGGYFSCGTDKRAVTVEGEGVEKVVKWPAVNGATQYTVVVNRNGCNESSHQTPKCEMTVVLNPASTYIFTISTQGPKYFEVASDPEITNPSQVRCLSIKVSNGLQVEYGVNDEEKVTYHSEVSFNGTPFYTTPALDSNFFTLPYQNLQGHGRYSVTTYAMTGNGRRSEERSASFDWDGKFHVGYTIFQKQNCLAAFLWIVARDSPTHALEKKFLGEGYRRPITSQYLKISKEESYKVVVEADGTTTSKLITTPKFQTLKGVDLYENGFNSCTFTLVGTYGEKYSLKCVAETQYDTCCIPVLYEEKYSQTNNDFLIARKNQRQYPSTSGYCSSSSDQRKRRRHYSTSSDNDSTDSNSPRKVRRRVRGSRALAVHSEVFNSRQPPQQFESSRLPTQQSVPAEFRDLSLESTQAPGEGIRSETDPKTHGQGNNVDMGETSDPCTSDSVLDNGATKNTGMQFDIRNATFNTGCKN